MARKSQFLAVVAASLALSPAALAQSNPFQRPTGGGLSKAEVQRIVAEEAAKKNGGAPGAPTGDPTAAPGTPGSVGTGAIPSQPAPPITNVPPSGMVSSGSVSTEAPADPVKELVDAGGQFVGCIGAKPIFSTRTGRRVYFTAKELRKSNEARHLVRC